MICWAVSNVIQVIETHLWSRYVEGNAQHIPLVIDELSHGYARYNRIGNKYFSIWLLS